MTTPPPPTRQLLWFARAATLETLYQADFLINLRLARVCLGNNNRHEIQCLLTARADVCAAIEAVEEVE